MLVSVTCRAVEHSVAAADRPPPLQRILPPPRICRNEGSHSDAGDFFSPVYTFTFGTIAGSIYVPHSLPPSLFPAILASGYLAYDIFSISICGRIRSISSFTKNPVSSRRAAAAEIALAFLRVSSTDNPSLSPRAKTGDHGIAASTVFTASIFGTLARKMRLCIQQRILPPPRDTATISTPFSWTTFAASIISSI